MQKFVILVCVHFAVINLQNKQVDAAVAYGKADFSKSDKSRCEMEGEEHDVNVAWKSRTMCALAMCNVRDGNMFVSYTTCGMEWKPPGCKSVSNLDLDYPQCCPQIVCPEDTKDSMDYGARGEGIKVCTVCAVV